MDFRLFLFAFTGFCWVLSVSCKEDKDCNIKAVLQTDPHPDFAETARSLQAKWVAKDTILVIASSSATSKRGAASTNIWLGSKKVTGLFQFQKRDNQIQEEVNPGSLKVSPKDWKTAILISRDKRTLYVSRDGGGSWLKHSLPGDFADILLSQVNPTHMVVRTHSADLYASLNHGETWTKLASRVLLPVFAKESSTKEYLFYSVEQSKGLDVNDIYRVDLSSSSTAGKVIMKGMYRFFVDDKYLYASKENYTTLGRILFGSTRRFYVSTNYFGSNPTFTEVQLPVAKWSDHVQVMATHETGAFIHMSVDGDNEKGTLYVSDSTGVRFTKSLTNHLFKRISILRSGISFNDFYEVDSIRGVYITVNVSTIDKKTYHSSVITFNNGGSWQLLNPPSNSDCSLDKGCSLHLHNTYSTLKSYIASNVTLKSGPLSSHNAPGIIVAQASIGASRDYDPAKSVIVTSQDGGHTWTKPDIPSGQYTYGIADYGNVITVVPDSQTASYIWFSHDRGVCFKKEQLDTTNYFKLTKGLLIDPNTTSLFAFALGLEGNDEDDAWRMIAINFGSVLSAPCHKNDYTTAELGSTCIMGYKEQYQLVKSDSVCYTENYSPAPKTTPCNCTYNDMECEFGYIPSWTDGVLNCTLSGKVSLEQKCLPGQKYYYQTKTGLRVVAGNKCVNTTETAKLLAYERKKCKGHTEDSGIDTSNDENHNAHSGRTAAQVIGAIIIIIALIAAAGLALYCVIKFRKPREFHDRVVYKKVPLTENGFSDGSESDDDLLN